MGGVLPYSVEVVFVYHVLVEIANTWGKQREAVVEVLGKAVVDVVGNAAVAAVGKVAVDVVWKTQW